MRIFHQIVTPDACEYARFSRRGTWTPKPSPGVCKECGMTGQKRVPPLIIEWEPDSDIVGDFAWGGFGSELVCRRAIAEELVDHFTGFALSPIEMVEDGEAPHHRGRERPRVSLPYTGPELCELWIDSWVSLDETASAVMLERTCGTCGFRFYESKKHGLVVRDDKRLSSFFRLEQFPSWMFCTDDVKDFITDRDYSNISFKNVGVIG
jgi:hypothetical protein